MTDREFIKRLASHYRETILNQWDAFNEDEDVSAMEWFGHGDDCLDKGIEFGNQEIYLEAKEYLESVNAI